MTNNEEKLKIVIEALDNSSKTLDGVVGKLGKIQSTAKTTGTSLTKAFNSAKLIAVFTMLTRTVLKSIKASSDYIENLNLFEVAMGRNIKMAHQFTSAISENFGMDKSEVIRYMGAFSNLAESMGNTAKNAYEVSEALTTIGYDLASLWNISTASAMEKLQAGLVGQTKPLRSIGIDTTYATLQMYAFELGIKEQVKVLSQSDKQLLRTIAIMRQASSSWGDMAKTIETPANQMRVFKAQIDKVSRALGNLFLGLFGKILPYINAFLMIIYELLSALGRVLGFELPTYDAHNDFGGIQDDVDGVNDSVEKLNKSLGLMDFDELHNVNTKDANGAGDYSAGGYGDLLGGNISDIMAEYDKKLSSVRQKALDIRDAIMEWLGFTKLTNAETGEVEFKFNKITSGTIIAGLSTIYLLFAGISKLFRIGQGISMLFNGGGLTTTASALSKIKSPLASIKTLLSGLTIGKFSVVLLVVAGIVALGVAFVNAYNNSEEFRKKVDNALTKVKEVFTTLWQKVLVPLGNFLKEIFIPIWEAIMYVLELLWKNVIEPLAVLVGGLLLDAFSGIADIFIKTVIPAVGKLIEVFKWLLDNIFKPIVKFLWENLKPVVEEVFKYIGDIITSLKEPLEGIIEFLTGTFTGDWEKAWNGIKKIVSGVWNTLGTIMSKPLNFVIGIFESFINYIIDGWNKLKDGLNSISTIKMPSWLKALTGVDFKFSLGLSKTSRVTLRRIGEVSTGNVGFAKGGVITKPMVYNGVMTGENYRKEAIIPLQRTDIVDQFSNNISANIVDALGKINEQPIVNQFYVDGIKVTESVNKRTKEFNNMYGKNIA